MALVVRRAARYLKRVWKRAYGRWSHPYRAGLNMTMSGVEGTFPELVLYKFDTCPFCVRVMREVRRLGVPVQYRDTREDAEAYGELLRVGGKTQVPCLFINGEPMYESEDIVRFLNGLSARRA